MTGPLAIGLAAAQDEALRLARLLGRLDDRFRLLIGANRAAADGRWPVTPG